MMEMTTSSSISVKPRDRNTGIRVFIRCNSSGMHVQLVMNTPVCNHRVSSGCIMLCKSSKLVISIAIRDWGRTRSSTCLVWVSQCVAVPNEPNTTPSQTAFFVKNRRIVEKLVIASY